MSKILFVVVCAAVLAAAEEYVLPDFPLPCSGRMVVHNEFTSTNITYVWSNGFCHRFDTLYNTAVEKGNLEYIRRPDVNPKKEYDFIANDLITTCENWGSSDWKTDSSTYPDFIQNLRGLKFESRTRTKYNGRVVDVYSSKKLYLQRATIDVETGLCWLYEEFKAEHQIVSVLSYTPNAKVTPKDFAPSLQHCKEKFPEGYKLPDEKDIAC